MKTSYKINGMTCDHCVHHVTEALESVATVKSAKVSLKKNEALVKSDELPNLEELQAAVKAAGYELVG